VRFQRAINQREFPVSIFGKIKTAVFGEKGVLGSGHFGTPKTTTQAPEAEPRPHVAAPAGAPSAPAAPVDRPSSNATAPAGTPSGHVDVNAVLEGIAARKATTLNWQWSIVDLMKLLELDSSLANRKELATELGYQGAKDGSAEMNIWLHKAVMRELEKNGGTVSAALRG
jgi:hypothetical protein